MNSIITVICTLLIVSQHFVLGDEGQYKVEFVSVKSVCNNADYINDVDISVVEDESKATFNSKCTIVKEIPQDAICSTYFYKMKDGEYKKAPYAIAPGPCCEVLLSDDYPYHKIMKDQNVPQNCPFKEGTYTVDNYVFETERKGKQIPRGDFKVQFNATLPSGECIYGAEVIMKIVDK